MHHAEVAMRNTTQKQSYNIALLGNPNSGKSSVFNQLTGLRQKTGNFPGVTVDKKIGKLRLVDGLEASVIDFPGTYSLYPTSQDERIVVQTFTEQSSENRADVIVYVADMTNLEKHLLLFTQVRDLGIPVILALNMADLAQKNGLQIDIERLSKKLRAPVVNVSGRTGEQMNRLREEIAIACLNLSAYQQPKFFFRFSDTERQIIDRIKQILNVENEYRALLIAHHHKWLPDLSEEQRTAIAESVEAVGFESLRLQIRETMQRFDTFTPILQSVTTFSEETDSISERLDSVLMHRLWGPVIFTALMFLIFQAIFAWAEAPMNWIDYAFSSLAEGVRAVLPAGWVTDLLTNGVLAGLGGIMVFIPQIAILFFLISLLEEVGYMARAAFMFDRVMQKFGLNGRSIVALVSGGACAIPAIMSTRTISNWKERLITILVTPFISCSARIPVYVLLIGLVIPSTFVAGIFNLQGLAFMGLYLLGIIAALGSAWVFKKILKTEEHSFLLLELPEYRPPQLRNVLLTVWEKTKTFVVEAGKVILVISVVLWFLASYGPPQAMEEAEVEATQIIQDNNLADTTANKLLASKKIEASFAGHLGKFIEPAIAPIGFDWKIGIAVICSFAAREVFVGTMATIYSISDGNDDFTIKDLRERMAVETNAEGEEVYNFASSISLLIFYVFAMMCMSTLAVVYRETKHWKWPVIQFVFMTGLGYLASLLVYQWLS